VSLTDQPPVPEPSWWDSLPLGDGPPDAPVAVGGAATPATLVDAYRAGVFPWPTEDPAEAAHLHQVVLYLRAAGHPIGLAGGRAPRVGDLPWWCPDPRGVIDAGTVRIASSLRRRLRSSGWTTTMNRAFDDVVARCRRTGPEMWITDELRTGYTELHRAGWAHSMEVWSGDELVGGAFGILLGGIYVGESMFHHRTDASKVALVDLDARFTQAGGTLQDVQLASGHMRRMGAVEIPRARFLATLRAVRDDAVRLRTDRLPVDRLAARPPTPVPSGPGGPGGPAA
jgi:leucyl/phenylalanyl-tRNA--protein transferase